MAWSSTLHLTSMICEHCHTIVCWYRCNTKGAIPPGADPGFWKSCWELVHGNEMFRRADIMLGRAGIGVSENTIFEHGHSSKWHSNLDKIFGPTMQNPLLKSCFWVLTCVKTLQNSSYWGEREQVTKIKFHNMSTLILSESFTTIGSKK